MAAMSQNPYQPPIVPPEPDRHAARKVLAICIKIAAVPLGILAFPFALEATLSIVFLLFPRAGFLPWLTAIPLSVAAFGGIIWYGFRIANGIVPRPDQLATSP